MMTQTVQRMLVAFTALAVLAWLSPVAAQEQAHEEAAANMEQGELVWVDAEAERFAIQSADGTEMQFLYDDRTEVTGAEEGIAGLATATGTQVTVQYEVEDGEARATRIDIHADEPAEAEPLEEDPFEDEPEDEPFEDDFRDEPLS